MPCPKLLVPSIATGSCFAPDLEGRYFFVGSGGGGGGGYGIALRDGTTINYFCLLGILNSRLLGRFLRSISTPFRGGYIALNKQYIEQMPIAIPAADASIAFHNLVERTIGMYKQAAAAKAPPDKDALARQIHAVDRQIDRLVYELYGLTEDEIGIVEGDD